MFITKENRKKFLSDYNFEELVSNISMRKNERVKELLEDENSELHALRVKYDKARESYNKELNEVIFNDKYISDERGRIVKKAVIAISKKIGRSWSETKGFIFWFNENNKDGFKKPIDTASRLYSVADELLEEYTRAKMGKKKNVKYLSDDEVIALYSYKVSTTYNLPAVRNRKIRTFKKWLETAGTPLINRFLKIYLKDVINK